MTPRTPIAAAAALALTVIALTAGSPATAAPVWTEVEVIDVTGDVQDVDCIGPVEYLSGQVHIASRDLESAAGATTSTYRVRTVGLTAVALDSGLVYKDVTSSVALGKSNPTWYASELEDGSHGVRIVERIHLFSPGNPDAPSLRATWDFRIQRAHGYDVDPVVVSDVMTTTCG